MNTGRLLAIALLALGCAAEPEAEGAPDAGAAPVLDSPEALARARVREEGPAVLFASPVHREVADYLLAAEDAEGRLPEQLLDGLDGGEDAAQRHVRHDHRRNPPNSRPRWRCHGWRNGHRRGHGPIVSAGSRVGRARLPVSPPGARR